MFGWLFGKRRRKRKVKKAKKPRLPRGVIYAELPSRHAFGRRSIVHVKRFRKRYGKKKKGRR